MNAERIESLAVELHRTLFGDMAPYRASDDPKAVMKGRLDKAIESIVHLHGPGLADQVLAAYARVAAAAYLEQRLDLETRMEGARDLMNAVTKMSA